MLDLDLEKKVKPDYIKADGEKLYFTTSIPAKIVFSIQNETEFLSGNSLKPSEVKEKYIRMTDVLKEMFCLKNEREKVNKVIDNLTFEQIAMVIKYIFEQIGNVSKKKLNGTKQKTS